MEKIIFKILNLITLALSISWLIFSFDWEPAIVTITLLSSLYTLYSSDIEKFHIKYFKKNNYTDIEDVVTREEMALMSIIEWKKGINEIEKEIDKLPYILREKYKESGEKRRMEMELEAFIDILKDKDINI